jgi:hypothetical protein
VNPDVWTSVLTRSNPDYNKYDLEYRFVISVFGNRPETPRYLESRILVRPTLAVRRPNPVKTYSQPQYSLEQLSIPQDEVAVSLTNQLISMKSQNILVPADQASGPIMHPETKAVQMNYYNGVQYLKREPSFIGALAPVYADSRVRRTDLHDMSEKMLRNIIMTDAIRRYNPEKRQNV